jgi:hypothetical protein
VKSWWQFGHKYLPQLQPVFLGVKTCYLDQDPWSRRPWDESLIWERTWDKQLKDGEDIDWPRCHFLLISMKGLIVSIRKLSSMTLVTQPVLHRFWGISQATGSGRRTTNFENLDANKRQPSLCERPRRAKGLQMDLRVSPNIWPDLFCNPSLHAVGSYWHVHLS